MTSFKYATPVITASFRKQYVFRGILLTLSQQFFSNRC